MLAGPQLRPVSAAGSCHPLTGGPAVLQAAGPREHQDDKCLSWWMLVGRSWREVGVDWGTRVESGGGIGSRQGLPRLPGLPHSSHRWRLSGGR